MGRRSWTVSRAGAWSVHPELRRRAARGEGAGRTAFGTARHTIRRGSIAGPTARSGETAIAPFHRNQSTTAGDGIVPGGSPLLDCADQYPTLSPVSSTGRKACPKTQFATWCPCACAVVSELR
jgi:hypothetical protein